MRSTDICPICVGGEDPQESSQSVTWIQCSPCKQWFHALCLKIPEYEIGRFVSYHCAECTKQHGPSVLKRESKRARISIDYVALNEGETIAINRSSHFQLPNFLQFQSQPDIDIREEISKQDVLSTRMNKPVLIPKANLELVGMKLPLERSEITVDYIAKCCGDDTPVEVMDVVSQQGVSPSWKLKQWRDYFNTEEAHRDRIRNVISLEISKVDELGTAFTRPQVVRDLDLVDKVWDPNDDQERSKVTKYCLMSVKNCFTDFHIDFGGTSVYYAVLKGCKTFLMFPPTDENLELYTSWCLEPKQNFIWYPDHTIVKSSGEKIGKKKTQKISPRGGFKVTLQPGDLFLIPSGWIHSVHTPQDSIVIGGNYLTLKDMKMQLKIYDVERKTKVPTKFRFPMFNKVIWQSAAYYYNHQSQLIEDCGDWAVAVEVIDEWIRHLSDHCELSKTNQAARKGIPESTVGKPSEFLNSLREWKRVIHAKETRKEEKKEH
ncbi:uncharacterized protein LODBEIA_P05690 [Lodderomyces beijingensis]|uniref:JmjC domain-containing histone demethylation protein 1 n=1 Tax=Lodderomyces beijingensis TaxID=1775926 RepID=A0ABP0ZJ33_9ASCO